MTESAKSSKKKSEPSFLPNLEPTCSVCGSDNVFGISRVVGYFSVIENWNGSKQAEFKRRQKGKYWSENIPQ